MATLRLEIELTYDAELMHGDDPEGIEWFRERVLKSPHLILHENGDLGDCVGDVRVLSVSERV